MLAEVIDISIMEFLLLFRSTVQSDDHGASAECPNGSSASY
jgi:hypothetical protein